MPTSLPPSDPPSSSAPGPGTTGPPKRESAFAGVQGWILIITLGVLLAMFLLLLLRPPEEAEPKRIRIADPVLVVSGPGSGSSPPPDELWTTAAIDTLERHLASRRGLWGISRAGTSNEDAVDRRADEDIVLELECGQEDCTGSLRRIRTLDGVAVWHRPGFRLPADDLLRFTGELGEEIELAYLRHRQRRDPSRLYVEEPAYRRFLRCRKIIDSRTRGGRQGASAFDGAIRELHTIVEQYPRFADAYLLTARALLARDRGRDRVHAFELLGDAKRIAEGDGRALEMLVPLALELDRGEVAADALERLTPMLPRDPRLPRWRRDLTAVGPARASAASGGEPGS